MLYFSTGVYKMPTTKHCVECQSFLVEDSPNCVKGEKIFYYHSGGFKRRCKLFQQDKHKVIKSKIRKLQKHMTFMFKKWRNKMEAEILKSIYNLIWGIVFFSFGNFFFKKEINHVSGFSFAISIFLICLSLFQYLSAS